MVVLNFLLRHLSLTSCSFILPIYHSSCPTFLPFILGVKSKTHIFTYLYSLPSASIYITLFNSPQHTELSIFLSIFFI